MKKKYYKMEFFLELPAKADVSVFNNQLILLVEKHKGLIGGGLIEVTKDGKKVVHVKKG